MIANPANRGAYSEAFDMDRLYTIAGMAIKGKTPDWHFSDMECHVWNLMQSLIREGSRQAKAV